MTGDPADDIPFPDDDPGPEDRNEAAPHPEEDRRSVSKDGDAPEVDTRPISERAMARNPSAPPGAASRPAPNADYLAGLNAEQRDAVLTTEGPLLVLAGAGTGKTRVLTTRVAHILREKRAWPSQMLVVTFTNKAAREMRERTLALVGPDAEGLRWLGTFHSVSAQMLRRHCELVRLKPSFTVIDTDDQIRLIKQILDAENIDPKRWTPRFLAGLIDTWKNRAITPDKLPADQSQQFAGGKGKRLYEIYQQRLATLNAVDFGDLLLHTIRIFQENPEVLAEYHKRFRYLLVDEYQDTNVAQYLWLRLLAQGSNNICCVGDDDQSIYGWRGAEVDNILRFDKDFPGAKVIRLEQNYRSTAHILAAASKVISGNAGRLGKTLRTDAGDGDLVKVRGVWDGEAEARLIADDIQSWISETRHVPDPHPASPLQGEAFNGDSGHMVPPPARGRTGGGHAASAAEGQPAPARKHRYDDCAVLVRASWQMRAFEERFILTGTPYRVIGGPRFFERAEIRDAMAYLRLIRSPADDLAFERVVNQPKRGVGATSIQKLQIESRSMQQPLTVAADMMLRGDEIKGPAKTGIRRFLIDLENWRALYYTADPDARMEPPRLLETILEESGYTDMLQKDKSPQSQTRLDNLKELVRSIGAFDTLEAFLEHVELVMDNAEGSGAEDQVQILTLHSAKGLEWPMVFLPGWEEEVFPSKRSLDESGNKGLEEERRLAYVAITRARQRCYISFVANRQIYGRWTSVLPSRFIDELPPQHVEAVSDTGYVSPGGQFYGSEVVSPLDGPHPEEPRSGVSKDGRAPSEGRGPANQGFKDNFRSTYDSPGWKRARAAASRKSARPPDLDASGKLLTSASQSSGGLELNQRIFHQKFGYGRITHIEGTKLTVDFEKAGVKKVVETFVERV